MNSKKISHLSPSLFALSFFAFLVIACNVDGVSSTPSPTVTSVPTATLFLPSPTAWFLPNPSNLTPVPTDIPYPTASVVKIIAMAFISRDSNYNYSLWIANVDGSGERKITDIESNAFWGSNYLLQWSPDGKWISYISGNDLWIISPDGSINKKILSSQDVSKKVIRRYAWSPDSKKIAYLLTANGGDFPEIKARLLDLITENDSEIFVYQSPANIVLSWSPDGRYLLLNTKDSLKILEVNTGKVRKEIRSACPIWHGEPSWSPNSEWFYRPDFGTGYYYIWVCMNGLDGTSWQAVDGVISQPAWDKTGDYLYFVDGKMNLDIGPNWFTNQRLIRYNIRAKKNEDLLSLEEEGSAGYPPIISLSPNGQMLGLYSHSYIYTLDNSAPGGVVYPDPIRPKQNKFIILDLLSLPAKKYVLEFEGEMKGQLPPPMWSPDSEKIVFFLRYPVYQSYGIVYGDFGSFYSLDIATGKVSLFSGVHAVENAIISPIAKSP